MKPTLVSVRHRRTGLSALNTGIGGEVMTSGGNFYDNWLSFWDQSQEEKNKSRAVIHDEELEWVETPQDYRIALMAGPENGFRTWGSEVTIADIPTGCHTGKHEHGEEGIYIVE